ncbi:PAS domain-containing sensor histidine kinase [Natrarchaeobius halalkaliphilus]|uniref:histidine kinase n=1 Tax=Natrarchaeobius halalkaliphilus TaxID=1679091 RepID=A0A3N6N506_9EURY|nr:PAS domain-containing sensor histidine kinase [Natrarchaeobius halalkaliphilus]RQG93292.1 PAS domain-containing sensor histidine kinase [Natrarchaeobius halalkaliphilus]
MDNDPRERDGGLESTLPSNRDPDRFRHLIEHIQDAVVEFELVDGEPIVGGVNPAFVDVFGYEAAELIGSSLNRYIVPKWLEDEATTLDDRTTAGKVNYRHVRRETADGLREFLYRGVPVDTNDGTDRGFAVYTDLTEDRRNRSRIDVLNRVLRHNLRNKVTLVAGSLEELLDEHDSSSVDSTDQQLYENACEGIEELRTLSREAGELYRIVEMPALSDSCVDCVPLARTVADRFESSHPAASIALDLPETLPVGATERLEVAITSLVQNAIEHNPADEPQVWIDGGMDGTEWCYLAVDDDGPGIPPVERDVITGDAEITETTHGSGLGLWLVKWSVETFGGELSFVRSRAGGSRVQLRLRHCRDDDRSH